MILNSTNDHEDYLRYASAGNHDQVPEGCFRMELGNLRNPGKAVFCLES
jgi:hypothetical protein